MEKSNPKGAIFTGIIAAIAASSCCIPPLIALVAGVGGASSSLAWVEPFRPYLIGFAIIAITYSWYTHLKTKPKDDCGCEVEKPKFYQTRSFLMGMTIFALLSITLPYYSHIFYAKPAHTIVLDKENIIKADIKIEGMTCAACENHIDHAIYQLDGIITVHSSYDNAYSQVTYDRTKTSKEKIISAINSTGYKAIRNEK